MGVCAWRCFYLLWSSCFPEFVVFVVIVVDTHSLADASASLFPSFFTFLSLLFILIVGYYLFVFLFLFMGLVPFSVSLFYAWGWHCSLSSTPFVPTLFDQFHSY